MKKSYFLFLPLILFYSCTQPLYIPNTTNVPVLTKTGDTEINVTTGSNGWDLQAATALHENVGVMINASYANHSDTNSLRYNAHQFIELGLGYQTLLEQGANEGGFFSLYGGAGIGHAEGYVGKAGLGSGNNSNSSSGTYLRYFVQPSIGITKKHMDLLFAVRGTYVSFFKIYSDFKGLSAITVDGAKQDLFIEPTVTFKAGSKNVKGIVQMGFSKGLTPEVEMAFRQRPIILLIGLNFQFGWGQN